MGGSFRPGTLQGEVVIIGGNVKYIHTSWYLMSVLCIWGCVPAEQLLFYIVKKTMSRGMGVLMSEASEAS